MTRKATLILLWAALVASPGLGQDWAGKMFRQTSHDFGTVARGAKAEYAFELSNIFLQDVHIAGARSSCGCTSVRVEKPWLKTYEQGAIIASLNSQSYLGRKGATITVTFDQPSYAEVQLQVSSFIRGDVVFEPSSVQFGSVAQGTPAESKAVVHYAGRSDWKILAVRSANPCLKAEAVQTVRGNGQVAYELIVQLSGDAPTGYINEQLALVTDEQPSAPIPVAVEGRVVGPVTVSPASLFLGVVQPGQKVTKQLVVRGCKPFRILSIQCDDESFAFDTPGGEPKPLHLIPVTFVAGPAAGKVTETIRIETDLGNSKPELSAYGVIAGQ